MSLDDVAVVSIELRRRRFFITEMDLLKVAGAGVNLAYFLLFFQFICDAQGDVIRHHLAHGVQVILVVNPFLTNTKGRDGPLYMWLFF